MWISVEESGLKELREEAFDADGDQPVDGLLRAGRQLFALDPLGHKNFPRDMNVRTIMCRRGT